MIEKHFVWKYIYKKGVVLIPWWSGVCMHIYKLYQRKICPVISIKFLIRRMVRESICFNNKNIVVTKFTRDRDWCTEVRCLQFIRNYRFSGEQVSKKIKSLSFTGDLISKWRSRWGRTVSPFLSNENSSFSGSILLDYPGHMMKITLGCL